MFFKFTNVGFFYFILFALAFLNACFHEQIFFTLSIRIIKRALLDLLNKAITCQF